MLKIVAKDLVATSLGSLTGNQSTQLYVARVGWVASTRPVAKVWYVPRLLGVGMVAIQRRKQRPEDIASRVRQGLGTFRYHFLHLCFAYSLFTSFLTTAFLAYRLNHSTWVFTGLEAFTIENTPEYF
jgi:hypothetical protein